MFSSVQSFGSYINQHLSKDGVDDSGISGRKHQVGGASFYQQYHYCTSLFAAADFQGGASRTVERRA